MKSISRSAGSLASIVIAAAALTGCATAQQEEHRHNHPEAASETSPKGTGRGGSSGGADGQMGMMGRAGADGQMDMKSMCDMHNKMMGSKTSAERSAMMDDHMKNMSPEMRQRHMEMIERQCK
jgi:hypothetical protein